jgi:Putative MetA-pathway of phenol degradation
MVRHILYRKPQVANDGWRKGLRSITRQISRRGFGKRARGSMRNSVHLFVLALFVSDPSLAAESGAGSGEYSLFNPTPAPLMREFNTDRPSITEGPFTIDPGHLQTESDFANFTKSKPDADGAITETIRYGSTNIRLGVASDLELDFVLQPYTTIRTIDPTSKTWAAGIDTAQLRAKYNIYGNDTYKNPGAIALGIIPFVNIPTAHNGVSQEHVDGGFIVPFQLKMSDKIDLNVMTELDYIKNEMTSGHHFEYVNTGALLYQLTDKLGTYIELATRFGNESPLGGIVIAGGGFTYKLAENVQADIAMNIGLTRASDRINVLAGISRRY